jgi:hypothetical protein
LTKTIITFKGFRKHNCSLAQRSLRYGNRITWDKIAAKAISGAQKAFKTAIVEQFYFILDI